MIRILTMDEPHALKITLDGQLIGDYVDAVQLAVHQAIEQRRPVKLFLRDVSHIDERGRRLLSQAASKGVALSASGVYSSYIVSEAARETDRGNGTTRLANGGFREESQ